ncbi:DEAD/DEAH box helicase family protein [Staphylococcus shinii]|uniref:DEAD/DEAH box helicase family protein n=1 Tax=Staphylococcus shinii TaxID=2912228 RepID=UPI003F87F57A
MTKKKRIELPLLDEVESIHTSMYSSDLSEINEDRYWEVPSYLSDNMVHTFRDYQNEALVHFHYSQVNSAFKHRNINHVLFNMATGSGKTDLMAGLILYLYQEHGYQNFLFLVDKRAIVQKTIDNLYNKSSDKYLFNDQIELEGERITIRKVDVFPKVQMKNTIYLKLDTVQGVSSEIYAQEENAMGEKDYSYNKVVILGDEAHHYSSATKNKEKNLEQSWEHAITTIVNARNDNKLLEFTATVDYDNKYIYEKYKDKIINFYTLDRFIVDGFSKYVYRIQSKNSDEENMMNAILLSEYRRRYALEVHQSNIKPVVMFKSQRVATSNEAEKTFINIIENLSPEAIQEFIRKQELMGIKENSHTLSMAYDYYKEQINNLPSIVMEIKREFAETRIINANDNTQSGIIEKGQYENLNSLESPSNLFRIVFAVAKLTEGWDVLNLYDIVRLSNDPKTDGSSSNTLSEAQLIGRGARYNPFKLEGKRSFKRRFERDTKDSLLLETIHYHTINEPQYLENLMKSLDEMDLPTGRDIVNPPHRVKVKSSFKKTNVWKYGKIYYNETKSVTDEYYDSLEKYGLSTKKDVYMKHIRTSQELDYKEIDERNNTGLHDVVIKFDKRYLTKIMHKNSFYHFDNLKKYIPLLHSTEEFLDMNWLNVYNRTFYARVPKTMSSEDITPNETYNLLKDYFDEVEEKIKKGFKKQRGTGRFVGYPIKDFITDYNKRKPNYDTANLISNQIVDIVKFDEDHFVYDSALINQNEQEMVNLINERVYQLMDRYSDVYLIRMDENMHRESAKSDKLKLHQFGNDVEEYRIEGFQPDFILYLKNENYTIQIFIEPKGVNLDAEQWKEDLLLYLNNNEAEIEFEDEINDVRIRGVRFYTRGDERGTINQIANIALGRDFDSLSTQFKINRLV